MQKQVNTVAVLGEVLWDVLPAGPRLGGASANFAVMAARLGSSSVLASRVGDDALGRRIREQLAALPVPPPPSLPVDLSCLQIDPSLPTSTVDVAVDPEGHAAYIIHTSVAWDAFEFTPAWQGLAQRADAVCFGSLAQRSGQSRITVQQFISATRPACLRVFDLNLRPPHYQADTVCWSLQHATLLKLNEDELPLIFPLAGLPEPAQQVSEEEFYLNACQTLLQHFPLQMVCLTLGGNGSLLVTPKEHHRHPGVAAKVVDTVGAGDAFLATITHYALQGASLAQMNDAANRCGAWVASQAAAIPPEWPGIEALQA